MSKKLERKVEEQPLLVSVLYENGLAVSEPSLGEVPQILSTLNPQKTLLWQSFKNPSDEFLLNVCKAYGIDTHTSEDIVRAYRRPGVTDYGRFIQIDWMMLRRENKKVIAEEVQIIFGQGFLFTVRRGDGMKSINVRERLKRSPDLIARGSDYVTAEILETITDYYIEVLDELEAEVKTAEQDMMLRGFKEKEVRRLYRLRRDMLRIHMILAPCMEICRRLSVVKTTFIEDDARINYGVVADRLAYCDSLVSSLSDALSFAFETSVMINDIHQTDITKKLASWAAILAVPTAIAGIYGMNFEYMPELKWVWGYPVVLLIMLLICIVLYMRFKKSGWL